MKTTNFLCVTIDGCKYDAFSSEFSSEKTPNFDSIGPARKCYSPSPWTIRSLHHILIRDKAKTMVSSRMVTRSEILIKRGN